MTTQFAAELLRQALWTTFWVSLPLLVIGFLAGIVISLVQILTSIQDPGFGAVPRLAAFLGGFLLFLPWMLLKLISYSTALFGDLGRYAR
ncbi:MAG: flagellar biosynthetic protein FliQ [Bryobacter sp.]|jgi:flagellar biosynthetic protein FliQ|nr:flagellar biosynthetic protein FliQ [Bryobacter sp.]